MWSCGALRTVKWPIMGRTYRVATKPNSAPRLPPSQALPDNPQKSLLLIFCPLACPPPALLNGPRRWSSSSNATSPVERKKELRPWA